MMDARLAGALLVLILLSGCDPGPDRVEAPVPAPDLPAAPSVELVLLGGDVDVASSGSELFEEARLGMPVGHGDRVRTGTGARAVLRFGDGAVVWLQEDSEAEVVEPVGAARGPLYGMYLREGSLAALSYSPADGAPRLRIRAPQLSAVATGTNFLVAADSEGTTVAVGEGSVAVFPSGVDLHSARSRLQDSQIIEAFEQLLAHAVELRAEDQLRVESQSIRESDSILGDAISEIEYHDARELDEGGRRRAVTLLEYSGERISRVMPAVERIYAGSRSVLDQLASASTVTGGVHGDPGELAEIRIETVPEDTEILLDGVPIGRRVFSSLFARDETVRLLARRDGYTEQAIELRPPHERSKTIRVELEPLEPAYTQEEFLDAVVVGDHGRVQRYLETGGNVNAVSPQGYHALALVLGLPEISLDNLEAFDPDIKLVERLLEAGVAVNLEFHRFGQQLSALHVPILTGLAADRLNLDLVELLLRHGANPDHVLETGTMRVTPLATTLIVGIENRALNLDLMRLLLENGADPNISTTYDGRVLSPLMIAVVLGAEHDYAVPEAIELLAEHGADVNGLVNVNGMIGSPLYFAEQFEQDALAEVLRRHGAQL